MRNVLKVLGLGFVVFFLLGLWMLARPHPYREALYEKHYTWNDYEVGKAIWSPQGLVVPAGRFSAVVITHLPRKERRFAFRSTPAEVPPIPEFLSGEGENVTYKINNQPMTFDLKLFDTFPLEPVNEKFRIFGRR